MRTITIEHNGTTYAGQIGTIRSTALGYEDHGILTASLTVEWPGGGVSVGGFALDEVRDREAKDYTRVGTAYGLDHIIRIIETVGVTKWESLVGKQVIVLLEGQSFWGSRSVGIAHATDESKVLVLKEHADQWPTPLPRSMNVATAGSIVLYDRHVKALIREAVHS